MSCSKILDTEVRARKIRAYSRRIVGAYFHTEQKWLLIRPLLFDNGLIEKLNSYGGGNGLVFLRGSIFVDCVHECVLFTIDSDPRSASLKRLFSLLENKDDLYALIRENYSNPPEIELDDRAQRERHDRFELRFPELRSQFEDLSESTLSKRFLSVRDKVTAHLEMRAGKFEPEPVTASDFGLAWKDLDEYLRAVEPIIFGMEELLVRTSYASFREVHEQVASDFWTASKSAPEPKEN